MLIFNFGGSSPCRPVQTQNPVFVWRSACGYKFLEDLFPFYFPQCLDYRLASLSSVCLIMFFPSLYFYQRFPLSYFYASSHSNTMLYVGTKPTATSKWVLKPKPFGYWGEPPLFSPCTSTGLFEASAHTVNILISQLLFAFVLWGLILLSCELSYAYKITFVIFHPVF